MLPYTAAQFAAGLLSRAVPMVATQPVQSLLSETTTPYTEIVPGIVGLVHLGPRGFVWATISHISNASLSHANQRIPTGAGWDGPGWIHGSTVQLRWYDLYDCCISCIQNVIYVITFGEGSEHLLYGVLNRK